MRPIVPFSLKHLNGWSLKSCLNLKPSKGKLEVVWMRRLLFNLSIYNHRVKKIPLTFDIKKVKKSLTKMLLYDLCFTFFLLSAVRAKQNGNQLDGSRGLKRGAHVQGNRVSYGNFAVDKFHRLQVSVGSSSAVSNYRECALSCVNTPPCSSFNVASSPRSDGKYRCELLNEDKYSASPGQLVSSQDYHHYSIKVF